MIVLLTVLTLAEITRMSAVVAVVRCSTLSVLSRQGCRSAGPENAGTPFDRTPDAVSPQGEFDTCLTMNHRPASLHDAASEPTFAYPARAQETCRS
jgi:hypothetical protein